MMGSGLTPLAPVLVLMLGAAITKIAARFIPSRERSALALLMGGGAFVSILLLAYQPASHVVISPWHSPTLFESQLAYSTEGLAAPFALLVSLVCLAVAISLSKWRRETDDNGENSLYPAVFVVSAAGLSFIYSANLITLCLSWAFLDLSLLFLIVGQGHNQAVSNAGGRALMTSSLTGLSLVIAALLLDGYGLSPALIPSLILVAALVRASFYPLHFWMLTNAEMEPSTNTFLRAISIAAGISLLAKLQEFSPQKLPYQSQLVTISSLALLATALSAWAEQDRRRTISCIAINQVVLAVLSAAVVGSQAKSSLLWSAINLVLCLSLLNLRPPEPGRVGRYGLWLRVPTGLAIASLMGLPFTMGFVGRAALYRSLFALGQPYLWGLSMVADAVLFAALFRIGAELLQFSTPNSPFSLWMPHLAGAIILAVPLVLLGIHPPLTRFLAADVDLPAAAELIGRADIALWAVLLLPLVGGYLLHRGQKATLERSDAFWKGLGALLSLDWLHRWLSKVGWGIGAVLRGLGLVTEGEGYLGWTLLLAFIAFLLLSNK
jgi:NADH:ubiquinone oxidoreductase subunit 5 (subunit L)/multisubunit Na+/H+ antiporter MnhA subunit